MLKIKRTGLKISLLFLSFILFISIPSIGQEECEQELNSKTIKLLEKGKSKGVSRDERIEYLEEAIEIDGNCLECNYLLGIDYFKKAKSGLGSYNSAEESFKNVLEICPYYHSDTYYYLGLINYGRKNNEQALKYFKEYLSFPTDDPTKFSKNQEKDYEDVKEVVEDLEFNISFYGNPVNFNPVKVNKISTSADEYLPTLSPDNEIIFITRKSMKQAKGDLFPREIEELTWGRREDSQSDFDEGFALEAPFNLGDNYGGVSLSINNKEMFVTVCKPRTDGYNNCDIYVSHFQRNFDEKMGNFDWGWTELENLGTNINTPDGWEAQPSVAGDGMTLYFATARENSLEHSIDIFYSERNPDHSWSEAKPIGGNINTKGNEKSPFIHSDSKTLYFSSDGRKGAGAYDIYYTRFQKDSTWSEPANIGYPINSDKDEHGLIVSIDGVSAYYASNQIQGHGGYDIYQFELPNDAKPEAIVLLKGEVDRTESEYVEDIKVTVKNVQTQKITKVALDKDDGKFAVVMNVEENDFIVEIEKEGAPFDAHVFTKEDSYEVIPEIEYKAVELTLNEEYVINDIHYKTNSADFDKASGIMLSAFAEYLKKNPSIKVIIQGHTDNVGDDLANYALSADRAFTVKQFLESKGIAEKRIDFKGLGETEPISSNDTEEGRALNRRTTFKVVAK